ncbi:MAG: Maf family protein [Bauldia sp.]|nr:Maf family protein [Bauldia sp.]
MRLLLASTSPTRRLLLERAGIAFTAVAPKVDERATELPLLDEEATPTEIAEALALAKAKAVSRHHPEDLVIGADQTLDFGGMSLSRPESLESARRQLLALAGGSHWLRSAVCCVKGEAVLWQHVASAEMAMRPLTAEEVSRYLAEIGDDAVATVGAYQIEGPGIRLFERIEGDYFAILGLPLLPLLAFLRSAGAIA